MDTAFELLSNLHNSFIALHEERMQELNDVLGTLQSEESLDNSVYTEMNAALEELLK